MSVIFSGRHREMTEQAKEKMANAVDRISTAKEEMLEWANSYSKERLTRATLTLLPDYVANWMLDDLKQLVKSTEGTGLRDG